MRYHEVDNVKQENDFDVITNLDYNISNQCTAASKKEI